MQNSNLNRDTKTRIVYFASQLIDFSGDSLKFAIQSVLGTKVQISDAIFSIAVKELACLNAYLSIVEQVSGNAPKEVIEFLGASLSAIDALVQGDPSRETMINFQGLSGYEICSEAATLMAIRMGIATAGVGVIEAISEVLRRATAERLNLLLEANCVPIEKAESYLKTRYCLTN